MRISLVALARGAVLLWLLLWAATACAWPAQRSSFCHGREEVYVLHSTKPFDVTWALQALRAGRPLNEAAPAGISVGHASFVKVPRP